MGYEIEETVIHDELGEGVVRDESYMHINDIEVQAVIFQSIPEDFENVYGCGIEYFWDGAIVEVAVMDLTQDNLC